MKSFLFLCGFLLAATDGLLAQTLQGNIVIATAANEQVDHFAGGHFQVELWHVNYAQDKQDAMTTDILLQQKVNARINVDLASNGLRYTIADAPREGNLAIIVYVGNQVNNSSLRIIGKPSDGRVAIKGRLYKSDAKKFLGKNIVYGVYSVNSNGGSSVGSSDDFRVFKAAGTGHPSTYDVFSDIGDAVGDVIDDVTQFVTKTINGVVHTFDQTIDGISGLSKVVAGEIQGLVNTANFYIDETGKFYYMTVGGLDNLILYGNLPKTRDITPQEYNWANSMIYHGALPPASSIKIFNFMNMAGDGHRFFTWPAPAGDYIYVNIGDAFDDPMHYTNLAYPAPGQAFIHELGHSWQCGKYGFAAMLSRYFSAPGGLNQAYDPGCFTNNINSKFDIEQEATLIDRSYVELYFPDKQDRYACSFSIPWVEEHVRNGVAFDKVSNPVVKGLLAVAGPVGGFANWTLNHSGGNPTDGDGYFMVGRINNGFLHYSNKTRVAACQWGAIRERYVKANYEFGALGWPARTELLLPDGVGFFQQFDHGYIYSHPKYGTFVVTPEAFDPWAKQGWERGKLGYPISEQEMMNNGHAFQKFVGGVIFLDMSVASPTSIVRYGNPNTILDEYVKANAGLRTAINPQPLPPKVTPKNAYIH